MLMKCIDEVYCYNSKIHLDFVEQFRSDEELMLETSAFESLYGGQFTLSTHLIKPSKLSL